MRGRAPLLLAVALWGLGCDPETEGCLDYRALEIDVTADAPCDGCCEFPSLRLTLLPRRFFGDSTATLPNAADLVSGADTLIEASLAVYLRDLGLERPDGSVYPLTDTVSVIGLDGEDGRRVLQPSVLLAEPRGTPAYRVGAILEPLEVTAVVIGGIGLPAELAQANPTLQPVGSPLALDPDSLLLAPGARLRAGAITGRVSALDSVDYGSPVTRSEIGWRYELPTPVTVERGFDLLVTVGLPLDRLVAFRERLLAGEAVDGADLAREVFSSAPVLQAGVSR